jgi:hypothetical protein
VFDAQVAGSVAELTLEHGDGRGLAFVEAPKP